MAPPKTPARKKNVNHNSTPQSTHAAMGKPAAQNGRPALVSMPTEAYAQAQEDELEVLKAIYMDDFKEVEAKGAWSV
jgi:translation initiation factor 2-alpha kinase 4